MSEISLILVLLFKTNKTLNDMAKIQIKSEKLTPFGGFFSIMEQFDALLAQTIDSTLGLRCTLFGYQYSEILRSLMCVYHGRHEKGKTDRRKTDESGAAGYDPHPAETQRFF
jgi:hypothetical protein